MVANLAGIEVIYPDDLNPDELIDDVLELKQKYKEQGKQLLRVEFTVDDEGYLIAKPFEKSPITRLRRIKDNR